MKKPLYLILFSCLFTSLNGQTTRINLFVKSRELTGDDIELVFSRNDIGDEGFGFKKVKSKYGHSSLEILYKEPFFCVVELKKGDSVLQSSNSFLVSRSVINIEFDINKKTPAVSGGENDFYFKNRFLLFELPAVIEKHPEFSCRKMKENYEFKTNDFRLQYYVDEYENNIIHTVSSRKNYFTVLLALYSKVECISLKTLEKCYNLFTAALKKTKIGIVLGAYIKNAKELLPGKGVPAFSVTDKLGHSITSDRLLVGNKYTLIEFWASWCIPCREQMKELKKLYRTVDTSKFQLISISIDSDPDKWMKASDIDTITWPNFLSKNGWQSEVALKFSLTYIPQNVLIDRNNIILSSNLNVSQLSFFIREKSLLKD